MNDANCFFTAEVTQYLRPNGRIRESTTLLPSSVREAYEDMKRMGYRLTAEVLQTGEVSTCISDNTEDVDCMVTANGPNILSAQVEMLNRKLWSRKERIA